MTLQLNGENKIKAANFASPESVEIMSRINLRAKFLGVVVVTIAAIGSLLTACSTNAQNQAQTPKATTPPSTTTADHTQPMDHGNGEKLGTASNPNP